jgi:hypothetical protein
MDLSLIPIWLWVILALSIIAIVWFWKGTSEKAGMYKKAGAIGIFAFFFLGVVMYPMAFGLDEAPRQDIPPGEIETNYSIVWAVDSTTAVISGDFSQTDEVASGEYAFSYDSDGNTVGVTVTNTCTALSACTWDAFSFTNTITADFKSEWSDGARITSVLGASIDSSILDWGVVSNRTSINVPFVDRSPLDVSGLIWVDGAGTNKAIGATTAISLNEFSAGESVSSAGLYFAVNEDQYSTLYNVPTGIYSGHWNIVYSDDYGFSHTVVLTITLTNA